MYTLVIILIIVVCLLLVGVVMVQNSKGGGLASDFSSSNQIIGVQRTGDFLEKATWYLTIALMVLTLGSNFFIERGETQEESAIQEQVENAAMPAQSEDAGEPLPVE
ncbi:MAG: preprotein translocase subunit SecG [Flavobacteriales bacterium]|nr:preprotein translocase subunit SecG [Flavobacteriales bacterium]